MQAPVSADEFLNLVRKSGLFDSSRFSAHFASEADLPSDPVNCANELIRVGLLTKYQAKLLLMGRYRGFKLGAYTLLEPLGKGGMGAVYLAEHTGLARKFAIKVLPSDKARDRLALERFQREARSVAALDHPNIVKLFDIGNAVGVHFLVLEYVDGSDLQTLIKNFGPLDYVRAVDYIAQAAAGLAHAHERGFIHRDIKPANIMLNQDDSIKILDMGLTRSLADRRDNLTEQFGEQSDHSGTIDFASPEHAVGQPTDERSDIYSLGATFCMLMTGKPPFSGTTAQKLLHHQMKDPPNLTAELNGKVPAQLSAIVARMMAKRKEDRYASAREVIEALRPWLPQTDLVLTHASIPLTQTPAPTSRVHDLSLSPREKRFSRLLMLCGLLTIVPACLVFFWKNRQSEGVPTSEVTLSQQSAESAMPTVPVAAAAATPVPTPTKPAIPTQKPVHSTVVALKASDLQPFVQEFKSVNNTPSEKLKVLPSPWAASVWRAGCTGEIAAGTFENFSAIQLKNTGGLPGIQLYTDAPWLIQPATAHAVFRLEYRTDGKAFGNLQVRTSKTSTVNSRRIELTNSNHAWREVELKIPAGEALPAFLCIQNTGPVGDTLAIRRISGETIDAFTSSTLQQLAYRLDLSHTKPFVIRKGPEALQIRSGSDQLPAQWFSHAWQKDQTHELFVEIRDNQPAIGLRQLSGAPGAMLCVDGISVTPGRVYELRLDYLALGEFRTSEIRFKDPHERSPNMIGRLKATGENGRSETIRFMPGNARSIQIELNHQGPTGQGHDLLIRKFEVVAVDPL